MSTSQCAVYQVKDTPEYRDVRFRSYEKLKSEGRTVQIENYQQVYIGRIQPGETPADIKTRLQKQRPKNFKGHSIQYSDAECLERVLQKTIDIDSVHSFYIQLKNILEYRKNVFNIYQYYSFALLYQVMERQNSIGYEGLMFLVMKYIERQENLIDCIYSSSRTFIITLSGHRSA